MWSVWVTLGSAVVCPRCVCSDRLMQSMNGLYVVFGCSLFRVVCSCVFFLSNESLLHMCCFTQLRHMGLFGHAAFLYSAARRAACRRPRRLCSRCETAGRHPPIHLVDFALRCRMSRRPWTGRSRRRSRWRCPSPPMPSPPTVPTPQPAPPPALSPAARGRSTP